MSAGSRTASGSSSSRSSSRSRSSPRSRRTSSRVANFFEVLRLSVELGLLAIALTPVIITGGIDLSVGSMMGLAAVTFGAAFHDWHLPIAVAAAARRWSSGCCWRCAERRC